MTEYHKIKTVYARDPETKFKNLLDGQYSTPEFAMLAECQWQWTEKVNGTNIRIEWGPSSAQTVTFGGKTENAQIPARLISVLQTLFPSDKFEDAELKDDLILYGEGYGAKIQKGGGNYISDGCNFVLFDIRIGDWWLERDAVEDVAERLGINRVPIVGEGTLSQMVEVVKTGLRSTWGNFEAEGIVARPIVQLFNRKGERIITKVKGKDFVR